MPPLRFSRKPKNEFYALALEIEHVAARQQGSAVRQLETGQIMFFPIRCVFWLTIVFTAIFSQDQAERETPPVTRISQALQGIVAKALGQVETRVAERCTSQPAECLGMAAKLSGIVKPDIVRPDSVRPEIAKSEIAKPEITKPEIARLGAAKEQQAVATTAPAPIPLPPPRPNSQASGAHVAAEKLPRAEKISRAEDTKPHASRPNGQS
jgi:hypothetical protein